MTIGRAHLGTLPLTLVALALAAGTAFSEGAAGDAVVEAELMGAWRYRHIASRGKTSEVTGLFIFHEGSFLQAAVHDGEPLGKQMAFAYAGSYRLHESGIQLAVDMETVVEPTAYPTTHFKEGSSYDCRLSLEGDRLTITFPSEAIQVLERVPMTAPPLVSGSYRIVKRFQPSGSQTPTGVWMFGADRFAYVGAVRDVDGKPPVVFGGEGSFAPVDGSDDELDILLERSFESGAEPSYTADRAFRAKLVRGDELFEIRYDGGDTWFLKFLR